jgi:hypothetical protein
MEQKADSTFENGRIPALIAAMFGGIFVIVIFALSAGSPEQFFRVACTTLFIAGASVMVGGLLGFLFGIPRSRAPEPTTGGTATPNAEPMYTANTNLEQISDWLVKMLVGVGLTQLNALPRALESVSEFVGTECISPTMAGSIMVYFAILGFLYGFLWTRLFLAQQMRAADLASLGKKVNVLEQQSDLNAKALNLVKRQLDPHADAPEVDEAELKDAIKNASPSTKTTIYYDATAIRQENTKCINENPDEAPKTISVWKDKVTKTIPIFRALAESDAKGEFHTNHGQLGFALKDQTTPDWVEAIKELSTAIDLRNRKETGGWLYYEFNRAICRIAQANPANNDSILADLKAAKANINLAAAIAANGPIKDWLDKNSIDPATLAKKTP